VAVGVSMMVSATKPALGRPQTTLGDFVHSYHLAMGFCVLGLVAAYFMEGRRPAVVKRSTLEARDTPNKADDVCPTDTDPISLRSSNEISR
jgi:hypothetical protein